MRTAALNTYFELFEAERQKVAGVDFAADFSTKEAFWAPSGGLPGGVRKLMSGGARKVKRAPDATTMGKLDPKEQMRILDEQRLAKMPDWQAPNAGGASGAGAGAGEAAAEAAQGASGGGISPWWLGAAGLGAAGAGAAGGYAAGESAGEGNATLNRGLAYGGGLATGLAAPHLLQGLNRMVANQGLLPGGNYGGYDFTSI